MGSASNELIWASLILSLRYESRLWLRRRFSSDLSKCRRDAASPPRTLEPNERPDAERTVQPSDAGSAQPDTLRLEVIPSQSVYRPQETFRIRVYQMTPDGMSDDVTGLVEFSILSDGVVEQFDDNRFRAIALGEQPLKPVFRMAVDASPFSFLKNPWWSLKPPLQGQWKGVKEAFQCSQPAGSSTQPGYLA